MARRPGHAFTEWFSLGFFGLCAIVFAWTLIRPQVLILDSGGFTLDGGFVRSPKKILWRDIERFFVYSLARGGKMVGYNLTLAARENSAIARISRTLGADGGLPKGWLLSPEDMVEDLNAYRRSALEATSAQDAPA